MFHSKRLSGALAQIAADHDIALSVNELDCVTVFYKLKYAGEIGIKKIRRRLRRQVYVIGPAAVLHGVA
jgi:hypothetical protein